MIWLVALTIFLAGCAGGIVNAILTGELKLPHMDEEARVFRPGWIGNALAGGMAGAVSWGLYGPLTSYSLIGPNAESAVQPSLAVAEAFGAVLVGFGGGRWLAAEVDRLLVVRERDALAATKTKLVDVLEKLTPGEEPR